MKKLKTGLLLCVLIFILPLAVFAHGGQTDVNGGHRDNQNESGLGAYHFHCNGYPTHLHENGVCPYSATSTVSTEKPADTPKPTVSAAPTATAKSSWYVSERFNYEEGFEKYILSRFVDLMMLLAVGGIVLLITHWYEKRKK